MFKWLKYTLIIVAISVGISNIIVFILGQTETTNNKQQTINNRILSKQVTAHAQVGGYTLNRLSGYTSPFAEVQLNSVGLARKTLANATGYFLFTNIPVLPSLNELCLVSQDVSLLPSFPTCLAPPPSDQNIDIIDVLLSPSISIGSSIVNRGSTVTASGMTFPDSQVSVYLFSVADDFSIWLKKISLVKTAYAFGLPKFRTTSNSDGYFEFSLPNSDQSSNRFYVASAFNVGDGRLGNRDNQGDKGDKGDRAPKQTNPTLKENLASDNNQGDFIPKTNLGTQATENTALETDLRESPKSNTLYFRSLGWLENIIARFIALFNYIISSFSNALALILTEMIITLALLFIIIYSRLKKDTTLD